MPQTCHTGRVTTVTCGHTADLLSPAEKPRAGTLFHLCKAGVRGSIPLVSTTLTSGKIHLVIH
jgi:hypothetical protein